MDRRIIKIRVGYGPDAPLFSLRSTSVAEDNRYSARFLEIPDKESDEKKAELEYQIYVDALASWSVEAPTKLVDGEEVPCCPEAATPADAVRQLFAERTPENERIPSYAIGNFRSKLQPSVTFL